MSAFKAYDFRGKFGIDFTLEDVYRIGFFLPELLKTNRILTGRDMRISSPDIYNMLTKGITDSGADVYDLGLCTTPMVYYFTAKHNFDASVMITASHNPKDDNGLKFSRTGALPVGYDSGLKELEEMVANQNFKTDCNNSKGKIIDYNCKKEYLDFLRLFKYDFSNLNIVIDCSNGMSSILVHDIFGDNAQYIYDSLDGNFPNHEANPLNPKNIVDLQNKVLQTGADIGVIFDGDADRVMFVDEKGRFISPDLIIAVLGLYFIKEQHKTGKVLIDIRTSKSVSDYIKSIGGEIEIWKVGRAYAALKLREIDGLFGGEFAGHYYFRDFYFSDSAMISALLVLHILSNLKKENITTSSLINKITKYFNSGEINFKIEQKKEAINELVSFFISRENPIKILDFDGYRIEFSEWWFNVRQSNTEPYLRLLMEAKNEEMLNEKLDESKKILSKYMNK